MKTAILILALAVGILSSAAPTWAMPVSPRLLEEARRSAGFDDALLAKPDYVDSGFPIPPAGHRGTYRVLLLLIDFHDVNHAYAPGTFADMAFGPWATGSMSDYYTQVSYSAISLNGQALGWYAAANDRNYYGNGQKGFGTYPQNAARLVEEAVDAAEAAGCDFSLYDNDGDGMAESIIVVHCGEGFETTLDSDDIQGHVSTLTLMGGSARSYDGVLIDRYACCPELQDASPLTHVQIGVFCHEYGHILGLPDLYDVSRWCTGTTSWGIGAWGLMAFGGWGGDVQSPESPTHMCAWSKMKLGWLTPTLKADWSGAWILDNAEQHADALMLGANGPETEYFLVEHRDNQTGFDRSLPGRGLLIYHVDETVTTGNDCENGGACTSGGFHYRVAIEQPDGNHDLDCGSYTDYADAGDLYPYGSADEFTDLTIPDSDRYGGFASDVSVTDIHFTQSYPASQMAFNVTSGDSYPLLAYDDGYYDTCYSYADGGGFAVRMTPPQYPARVQGAFFMLCSYYATTFQCRIWDAAGTGGAPGAPLCPVHTVSGATAYAWTYEDFSSEQIVLDSGDFWVVYIQNSSSQLLSDTDSPWSGRTKLFWSGAFSADNGAYGNYMIRAAVDITVPSGIGSLGEPGWSLAVGPNPFCRQTALSFATSRPRQVAFSVYDIAGRLVHGMEETFGAGTHSIVWNGTNDRGEPVGSGVYLYRFDSEGLHRSGRLIRLE